MSRFLYEARILEDLRKIYRSIASNRLTIVGLSRIYDDLFGPSHPGSSCPGQALFYKAKCEGNHPGIILPRQLAGAIILASFWIFE